MKKEHSKLMDKILQSLDWDSILKISKVLQVGVGGGSDVIPGVKRKPFSESLTKTDFRNELKSLLKHAIENDIPQLTYGNWIIYWVSDEWDVTVQYDDEDEDEDDEDDDLTHFIMEPQLEVIYCPQRISLVGEISDPEGQKKNQVNLEEMLEKAVKNEDYELATKIRDLILQNNQKKTDK